MCDSSTVTAYSVCVCNNGHSCKGDNILLRLSRLSFVFVFVLWVVQIGLKSNAQEKSPFGRGGCSAAFVIFTGFLKNTHTHISPNKKKTKTKRAEKKKKKKKKKRMQTQPQLTQSQLTQPLVLTRLFVICCCCCCFFLQSASVWVSILQHFFNKREREKECASESERKIRSYISPQEICHVTFFFFGWFLEIAKFFVLDTHPHTR